MRGQAPEAPKGFDPAAMDKLGLCLPTPEVVRNFMRKLEVVSDSWTPSPAQLDTAQVGQFKLFVDQNAQSFDVNVAASDVLIYSLRASL